MNNTRRHPSIPCLGFVALAFLLLQTSPGATADVIHLRTGESVKGRPLQLRSTAQLLVIEDLLSGAVRSISWSVVEPADRERLKRAWDMTYEALSPVLGHRLTIELHGGTREDLRGLILREDREHYSLLRGGKEIKIRKAMVVAVVREELDPRDIWSPPQLVERFVKELGKDEGANLRQLTTGQRFLVANYARAVGDFESARDFYEACMRDADFERLREAQQGLEEVNALLRESAALTALRRIGTALAQGSFRRVGKLLEDFTQGNPEAGEQIRRRLESIRREFGRKRAKYFQLEARIYFPKILAKLIKAKVREKEVDLSDVMAWTRTELPDVAFEALAARFRKRDDVTGADARAFWDGRPKSHWRTATYGSGTFIVEQPTIKLRPKNAKPPTRDQWWHNAATRDRVKWGTAFFVENSGLFEVSARPFHSLCTTCNGAGVERRGLSTGDTLIYLCRRCAGARRDRRVRFR